MPFYKGVHLILFFFLSTLLISCVVTNGRQGDVAILDKDSRPHLDAEMTMADYLAFAEQVSNKMLASPLVRSWGTTRPMLIVGDLENNTDNENVRVADLHDRIQETIFNSGLVRIVDKSATRFDYVVKTQITSTRQYGRDGAELAYFTMQMKMFKIDGELMGQWSDDLPLGKTKRRVF
jgi:penicillin-binding protein activator